MPDNDELEKAEQRRLKGNRIAKVIFSILGALLACWIIAGVVLRCGDAAIR